MESTKWLLLFLARSTVAACNKPQACEFFLEGECFSKTGNISSETETFLSCFHTSVLSLCRTQALTVYHKPTFCRDVDSVLHQALTLTLNCAQEPKGRLCSPDRLQYYAVCAPDWEKYTSIYLDSSRKNCLFGLSQMTNFLFSICQIVMYIADIIQSWVWLHLWQQWDIVLSGGWTLFKLFHLHPMKVFKLTWDCFAITMFYFFNATTNFHQNLRLRNAIYQERTSHTVVCMIMGGSTV